MPQTVAQIEHPLAAVRSKRLVVLVEVRNVVHAGLQSPVCCLGDVAALRVFEIAEVARKRLLLLIIDWLVVKHQHGEPVHRGFDFARLVG